MLPHPVVLRRLFRPSLMLLAAAVALALVGCSNDQKGPSPKAVVLAGEKSLVVAQSFAKPYLQLPTCTGTNGPVCSTVALSASIKAADRTAYNALVAAQAAVNADPTGASPATSRTVQAAQEALSALMAILASLPAK